MNKQIEEMANIIKAVKYEPFNYGKPTYTVGNQMQDFVFDLIAKELINLGYQKVGKDSVVLSREEYEVLKVKEKEKHWLETCISVWENGKIDGSKETAKKILKWLDNNCVFGGFEVVKAYFKEQFGVEIKE